MAWNSWVVSLEIVGKCLFNKRFSSFYFHLCLLRNSKVLFARAQLCVMSARGECFDYFGHILQTVLILTVLTFCVHEGLSIEIFVVFQRYDPGAGGICKICTKGEGDHYQHSNGNKYCVS